MSSGFCSLEEAFTGPMMPPAGAKKSKKNRVKDTMEPFVPQALSGAPDPDRVSERPPPPPEPMKGAAVSGSGSGKFEGAVALQDFFPLPGDTADPEEWQKAFLLEPSETPIVPARRDGSIPVAGRSTLWRNIPVPASGPVAAMAPTTEALAPAPSEVSHRLDLLTRQLESLTTATPLQTSAELFLFVAIGLLLILAMDTLLRFAMTMATRKQGGGGMRLRPGRLRWR